MWQAKGGKLYRKFQFDNQKNAFEFVNQISEVANNLRTPEIHLVGNNVEIYFAADDLESARIIDSLQTKPGPVASSVQSTLITRKIKLYADGGSRGNPGPSASGYVLMTMEDVIIHKNGVYLGVTTNNQAEYQALKLGMEEAIKLGSNEVNVFMDSLLVINQLKGIYKIRNRDLWPIYESINSLSRKFRKVTFNHVPRELNKLADREVNIALDNAAGK